MSPSDDNEAAAGPSASYELGSPVCSDGLRLPDLGGRNEKACFEACLGSQKEPEWICFGTRQLEINAATCS